MTETASNDHPPVVSGRRSANPVTLSASALAAHLAARDPTSVNSRPKA